MVPPGAQLSLISGNAQIAEVAQAVELALKEVIDAAA